MGSQLFTYPSLSVLGKSLYLSVPPRFLSLNKHWTHRDNMRIKWGSRCSNSWEQCLKLFYWCSANIKEKKKEREKIWWWCDKIRAHLWGISPPSEALNSFFFGQKLESQSWEILIGESYFVNKITNTEKKWLMNPEKSAMSL